MYAQNGDEMCPVKSLKFYLDRLNPKCEYLFQRPKGSNFNQSDVWYDNRILGVHTLDNKMKNLSKSAGLSQCFTNHCIRATVTMVLSDAGCESRNIMSVDGHRNEGSIKSYVSEPSMQQRADVSSILHNFGKDQHQIVPLSQSGNVKALPAPESVGDSSLVLQQREENVASLRIGLCFMEQISMVAQLSMCK